MCNEIRLPGCTTLINLLYASLTIPLVAVISIASDEHPAWRGHRKEAKRGPPRGYRITRHGEAMGSCLLTCATTWLSLIAVWCLLGETHRGQPWTPAVTLPHGRDGLRVLRMEVCCPCSMPSMGRPMHRQCMRNELARLYHYRTHTCLPPKK